MHRQTRLALLTFLTGTFLVLELIVGYAANSVALVADSFHMLSDVLSLALAWYAIKVSTQTTYSPHYTYGFQRSEILGALANGVALLALCFTIFVEAIQRFFDPVHIRSPVLVLITSCAGLTVNIFGLVLFHDHHHGHGHGHSHSPLPSTPHTHKPHSPLHNHTPHNRLSNDTPIPTITYTTGSPVLSTISGLGGSSDGSPSHTQLDTLTQHRHGHAYQGSDDDMDRVSIESFHQPHSHNHNHHSHDHHHHHHDHEDENDCDVESEHGHSHHHHTDLNMHGVFLHVLGDALGSIGVILSTTITIIIPSSPITPFLDPITSIIITLIIIVTSVPLIRSTARILMQGCPSHVDVKRLRDKVLGVRGVVGIHDMHVWQLNDTKLIVSLHITLYTHNHDHKHIHSFEHDQETVIQSITRIMHAHNIHSITIQPEYIVPSSHHHHVVSNRITVSGHDTPTRDRMASVLGIDHDDTTILLTTIRDGTGDNGMDDTDSKCVSRCHHEWCRDRYCCAVPQPT